MISAAFFAFADSVAWDHFFAILSNENELCSDGSQTKVTKIPAPFDFYEKLCFDTDELETFTFKAEYVDHCVVITSVPRGIHSVVPLVVGSQLRNWVKNRDLPITVSLNEEFKLSSETVCQPDVCACLDAAEFPCIVIEIVVSEPLEDVKAKCDRFLRRGSGFAAVFNFESAGSASFSYHAKFRDGEWWELEGPITIPGAVFGCEADCVLDRKEIEEDATRALRKKPLPREDLS